MEFIKDMAGEIKSSSYSLKDGRICLKLQYKSKVRGFLICVSDIFASEPDIGSEELREKLSACMKKTGNHFDCEDNEKKFSWFYVSEDAVRKMTEGIRLPQNSPAKVHIFWTDEEGNAHVEEDKQGKVLIPVQISAEIKKYKKGIFKAEWFCDITVSCKTAANLEDGVVCYRVSGVSALYPIPRQMIAAKQTLTVKIPGETVTISAEVIPEYRNTYKLQMI